MPVIQKQHVTKVLKRRSLDQEAMFVTGTADLGPRTEVCRLGQSYQESLNRVFVNMIHHHRLPEARRTDMTVRHQTKPSGNLRWDVLCVHRHDIHPRLSKIRDPEPVESSAELAGASQERLDKRRPSGRSLRLQDHPHSDRVGTRATTA